jgi:hypothetical protein
VPVQEKGFVEVVQTYSGFVPAANVVGVAELLSVMEFALNVLGAFGGLEH